RVVIEEKVDTGTQRLGAGTMGQVTHGLDEGVLASPRAARKSAEGRDTGDRDLRTYLIGGVRLQIPMRNLDAGLVDGVRRERPYVADRDRLIDVVEPRRR